MDSQVWYGRSRSMRSRIERTPSFLLRSKWFHIESRCADFSEPVIVCMVLLNKLSWLQAISNKTHLSCRAKDWMVSGNMESVF